MTSPHLSLQISFPKSSEDHRLQLVVINGTIFAVFYAPLESKGPIRLDCEEWNLILLAPIRSETHIVISGKNVVCLSEITSKEGNINIHATKRLLKFSHLIKPSEKYCEFAEGSEHSFDEDPGLLLYLHRTFLEIVRCQRSAIPDAIPEAQQKMIACLSTLADKVADKKKELNLSAVLKIWDIAHLG